MELTAGGVAANTVHAIYIVAALALTAVVYLFPIFDLRGVGRVRRARGGPPADEAEFAPPRRRAATPDGLYILPRADLAAMATLAALGAVAMAAAIGFLAPRALVGALGVGTAIAEWPVAAPEALGRVAQIVGAVAGALIAVRMLRMFMALAALALVVLATHMAVSFVSGIGPL